jgi:hypothetical protein
MTVNKLLVCVNASAHTKGALDFAIERVLVEPHELELLYVIDTSDLQNFFSMASYMLHDKRQEAQHLMLSYASHVFDRTKRYPSINIYEGHVGEAIIHAVSCSCHIKMVILGSKGDSPSHNQLFPWLLQQLGGQLSVPLLFVPYKASSLDSSIVV